MGDCTPMPTTSFDTAALDAYDAYKLLTGLVVPRPIGWVGSRDADGVDNLAPFSFFNAVAASPPTVMFAPTGQPGARKDTLANVVRSGEFTLSTVSEPVLAAMNATAVDAPAEHSEFEIAGATPVAGTKVDACYVAEAPAAMECRVSQLVEVGRAPMGSTVVFGEVLAIHVDDALLDGTRVDQRALRAVGRHAGSLYSVAESFRMLERPVWNED